MTATIETLDSLLKDMYPRPGTPLKQWVVDAINAQRAADKREAEERARRGPSRPLRIAAIDVANGVITLGPKR